MKRGRTVHIILNPTAGGGRAGRMIPVIKEVLTVRFAEAYEFQITNRPAEATQVTRRAIEEGARLIVAAGGDGTVQEIVNGFYQDRRLINPACVLGMINLGTGQGFALCLKPVGLSLPFLIYLHYIQLVNYEERALEEQFGEAYLHYKEENKTKIIVFK